MKKEHLEAERDGKGSGGGLWAMACKEREGTSRGVPSFEDTLQTTFFD